VIDVMPSEMNSHEYRLTGRFWAAVVIFVVCVPLIACIHYFPTTSWYGILGWSRFSGLTLAQHDEILQYGLGIGAAVALVGSLSVHWTSRTLLISPGRLTVFGSKLSGQNPCVIPLARIEKSNRFVRDLSYRFDNALTRRLRERVRFSYGGQTFDFCNAQFRSNAEFEDFCMRVGLPKASGYGQ
jgi:hypothetical protein